MRSVGSHSTSGREKEGNKERIGPYFLYACVCVCPCVRMCDVVLLPILSKLITTHERKREKKLPENIKNIWQH